MVTFKANAKEFYRIGAYSFLSKEYCGDQETIYSHCLQFYIPMIAKGTLKKHGLELGIFTMQGFEHRNKESKTCFIRFTNKGVMFAYKF